MPITDPVAAQLPDRDLLDAALRSEATAALGLVAKSEGGRSLVPRMVPAAFRFVVREAAGPREVVIVLENCANGR